MLVLLVACGGDRPAGDDGSVADDTPPPDDTGTTDTDAPPPDLAANATLALHEDMSMLVLASWDQLVETDTSWLSWQIDGETFTSPVVARVVGPGSEVVLGVPSDTAIDVVLHGQVGASELTWPLGTITTESLPGDLPVPTIGAMDPLLHRPERWLLGSVDVGPSPFFGPCYAFVLDDQGRIVWYRKTSGSRLTWQTQVSRRGGYVMIDESTVYTYGGTPEVTRLTLDLGMAESIELPSWGLTYDELDDGSFLYDEAENGWEFHLAHLAPDGTQTRLWSCWPWMQPYTQDFWGCAANTVHWDPTRNTVLWSMFSVSTVVELSLTGEMLAEWGGYPGGWTFDPPQSGFELQHYPGFSGDGTLVVSTHSLDTSEQWAREYEVDEAGMVLRQVWAAQTPYWAEYAGQAQKLSSGNVLWQLGTAGAVLEITPDGTMVWEVGWPGKLVGNVTPVADLYALTTGW